MDQQSQMLSPGMNVAGQQKSVSPTDSKENPVTEVKT